MLSEKAMGISPSPTMSIDSKAKELKSKGINVIGFGAGEPDFDTPPHIREAAIKAINEGHTRYTPAAGTPELREAICDKLRTENGLEYSPSQIVVSNGAKHALSNVFTALLNPGDEVMIPVPYWVTYPELVRLNSGLPIPVETGAENNFRLSTAGLKKACSDRCKALVLNSPTNPSGQVCSEEDLTAIAEFCLEREIYIISDEIYEHLIYGGHKHTSIASTSKRAKELTVVVNGVSKSYAMTGWRIGYTASAPEIAEVMANIQSHTASNPNSIAQKAAVAALRGPQDCVEEMRTAFDGRRRYMCDQINDIPLLDVLEPQGTFYMFVNVANLVGRSHGGQNIGGSDDFARLLLESYQVALVPGTGFGAPNYVRISFATSMDNIIEGLNRIRTFIGELD